MEEEDGRTLRKLSIGFICIAKIFIAKKKCKFLNRLFYIEVDLSYDGGRRWEDPQKIIDWFYMYSRKKNSKITHVFCFLLLKQAHTSSCQLLDFSAWYIPYCL
jgi:hypothetical protein